MDLWVVIKMLVALPLLGFAADRFIREVTKLAVWLKIPLYGVAAGVISIMTSLPEVIVSLSTIYKDEFYLSMGNIWGSVAANSLLVVGISALYRPILCKKLIVTHEMPFLMGSLLVWALAIFFGYSYQWSMLAPIIWLVYMVLIHLQDQPHETQKSGSIYDLIGVVFYFLLLFLASEWLILGAQDITDFYNVPEWIVGMTVLAIGTSLPELAVSLVAQSQGQSDIALGNVVGSNVFLILVLMPICVLIVSPHDLTLILPAVILALVGNIFLYLFALFFDGRRMINRIEGFLLTSIFFIFFILQHFAA